MDAHNRRKERDSYNGICGAIVEEFTDIKTFEVKLNDINDSEDKVLAYVKEVMSFGLLYMELVDAVREGDGLRVLHWWIFDI